MKKLTILIISALIANTALAIDYIKPFNPGAYVPNMQSTGATFLYCIYSNYGSQVGNVGVYQLPSGEMVKVFYGNQDCERNY